MGVLDEKELKARHEIMLENYTKRIQIEARSMGNLATNHILPAAIKYQNQLLENIRNMQAIGMEEENYRASRELLEKISRHINKLHRAVHDMIEARKQANRIEDAREKAIAYCDTVRSYFDEIRYHADKLELYVDDRLWPLPKYRELLYVR